MRHTIVIGDTEADLDAAPAGDIERATLALVADEQAKGGLRVFRSRPRGLEGNIYADVGTALLGWAALKALEKR